MSIYTNYADAVGGVSRSKYKLALVRHDQGHLDEAIGLKREAAALRKQILGIEPDDNDNEAGYDDLIMLVDH